MLAANIIPTINTSSEEKYAQELRAIQGKVSRVQVDIMDGEFVNNISIGASTIEKYGSVLSTDVHLMVKNPLAHINEYSRIGVDLIIFHAEAEDSMETVIEEIRNLGNLVGIALNLETPVSVIERVYGNIDMLQLMAVQPGFGEQKLNESVFSKVLSARERYPNLPVAIDGGVSLDNSKALVESGATSLVVGSHLFEAPSLEVYLAKLRESVVL